MQSAVANGKLDGQSVHGLYSTSTTAAMWSDDAHSTSAAAAADCRAIVPMLSGKSVIDQLAVPQPMRSVRLTGQLTSPA